jgi:DHA2 family multidrug resistance protein-like MFS transporter
MLWDAAASAFESGITVTSLIGAGLVVLAGLVAAVTLRTPRSH